MVDPARPFQPCQAFSQQMPQRYTGCTFSSQLDTISSCSPGCPLSARVLCLAAGLQAHSQLTTSAMVKTLYRPPRCVALRSLQLIFLAMRDGGTARQILPTAPCNLPWHRSATTYSQASGLVARRPGHGDARKKPMTPTGVILAEFPTCLLIVLRSLN